MSFLDRLRDFHTNPQIGKTPAQLNAELGEVTVETRKRKVNNNDTEDQDARAFYLAEARGRLN